MASGGWRGKVWRSCAAVWARLPPDLVAPGDRVTPKVVRTALDDVLRSLGAGPRADARSEPVAEWVAAAVADLRPDHNGFVGYEDFVDIAEQYCDFAALAGRPLAAAELPPPQQKAEVGAPQDGSFREKVERFCRHAFRWVDPEGMDVLNPSQAKTALIVVFGRLRAPPPPDEWHEQVFENFDDDEDGLIDAEDLVDIAAQYCEAHPPEGGAAAAGGAGACALPVTEPAGGRTSPDHTRPNNGLAGMGFGNTHPSAGPAYPSAGPAYPKAAGSAFGNTGRPYHGAGTTYGIAGSGLGNAGPGFGNAAPGFGNAAPGFGNAGPGFGNAGPGFGNAGPGFGNQRPGFGNAGPGFGNPRPGFGNTVPGFGNAGPGLGGAQMANGSVGPNYANPGPAHGSGGSDFGLGRPDNYGARPGYGSAGPAYGTGAVYGSGTWASHGNTGTSHGNWSEFGPGNAPYGNMAMPQDARVAAWQSRHGPLSMPGLPPPQSGSGWASTGAPHELGMPPLPSPRSGGLAARQQDSAMPPLPPPNSGGMPSMPPGPPTMPSQSSASRPQESTAPVTEPPVGQPQSAPGSAARARCESTGMPSLPGLSSQSTTTQPTLSSNSRPASKWDDLHSNDSATAAASKLSQAELDNNVRPSEQVTSAPASSAEATTPLQPQPDAALPGADHREGAPPPGDLDLRPSASVELAADSAQSAAPEAAPAAGQPPAPRQLAAESGGRASAGAAAPAQRGPPEGTAAVEHAQSPPRRAEGSLDHTCSVGTTSTRTSRADSASGFVVPKKSRGRKSTHFAEQLEEVLPVPVEGKPEAQPIARRRASRKGSVPIAQQVMTPSHRHQLSVFDDYEFVEEKGGGAFGRVMQVQHREAGFRRACKCVGIRSKKHMAAVDTEVALMRRLDHPNILRIFESYYDGDRSVYLVIELCSGGSLADRLKHYYPKPLPEAAGIALGLFSAVQYCHRRGIVHRDLKPENVLFTHCGEDASLKVIDFGLSDFRARLARMECQAFGARARPVCIGTPHYMAPEIYNENIYDEKVDTFACGVMLAEALTAVHPFFELGKDNLQTIRKNIIDGKVDWSGRHWARADPKSKDLVGKLLEPSRAQRLSALEALRHPWVAAALKRETGEAVSAEVFQCIERFCSWHVLGQAACRVLARQLDEAALAVPRADFRLLDLNGDGVISAWELLQGSRDCGAPLGQQDAAELMQAFDRTGQFSAKPLGDSVEYEIAWTEFLAAVLSRGEEASTEQAMYVFKRFAGDFEAITPESLQSSLTVNFGNISMHDASLADYAPPSNDGEVVSKGELDRVFSEIGAFSHLQGLAAAERLVEFRQFRAMLRPEGMGRRRSSV